jgi:cation diffusion facilitator CzcD-associated flavoprotein CzcO
VTTTQQQATANGTADGELQRHVHVAIIGSGFAGLGMAIKLRQAGIDDLVVFERDSEIGGTWWANSYPGCQCDIPSHLYSYSFAPNPDWRRTYATQPEIRDYLRGCAERFGVRDHVRTGTAVTGAAWEEDARRWRVETTAGTWTADALVAAPGGLSEPSFPDVPGVESFEGRTMHTARWDDDVDLAGRRIAVVGTGASAIQVVPEIAPIAEHLTVLQRTPPWVVPHRDRPITEAERRIYRRVPALQRLVRTGVYWMRELLVPGLAYRPALMKGIEKLARKHLATQVEDPDLRRRLTPSYRIGCKRILPSNKWYPALQRENVTVVTEGLAEVRPNAVVAADGSVHEVDTIIFATGFHVTDLPVADLIRGRGGRTLGDVWQGSMQAYRGTTVAGFPNLFFLVGPNTGLGHNSIVLMIESQIAYIMDALRTLRERGAAQLEVRPEAQEAYNAALQRRLRRTVWNTGGCSSWYLDASGRNTTIWPDFTWRFRRQTRAFDPGAYELTPAGEPAPAQREPAMV